MPFDEQVGNVRIEDNGTEIRIVFELPDYKMSDMIQFSREDSRNNNSSILTYETQYENIPILRESGAEYVLYETGTLFNNASHMYLRFAKDVSNLNSPNSTNNLGHAFVELGIAESMYHVGTNERFLVTTRTVHVNVVNTLLAKYNEEFDTQAGGKRRRSRQTKRRRMIKKRKQTIRRR